MTGGPWTSRIKRLSRTVLLFAASVAVAAADASAACECDGCDSMYAPCPLCAEDHAEPSALPPVVPSTDPSTEGSSDLLTDPQPTDPIDIDRSSAPQLAFSEQSSAFGGRRFSVPNQIGDNFGGGGTRSCIIQTFNLSGVEGTPFFGPSVNGSVIGFEVGTDDVPNDFFSSGAAFDTNGDTLADTVFITSPHGDAPTAGGPFEFHDGTATAVAPGTGPLSGDFDVSYTYKTVIVLPDPGAGGAVVGRMKIAENTNPLPQTRVFFNYSLFDNVPLVRGGVDVNRFSPGFEKAFAGGLVSYEMRFPFAATLDSNISLGGPTEFDNLEFGNIFLAVKALLLQNRHAALSAGLAMTLPTADDTVASIGGRPILRVENESVHVMPFIGWGFQHGRFFTTGFVQLDFDANGNPVRFDPNGRGLTQVGVVQDESYLYLDLAMGYWLWQEQGRFRHLTGVSPILELHWNRSLQESDFIEQGGFQLGEFRESTQILNSVVGMYFQLGQAADLTVGFTTPIGNGADQQFDGELRAMFNRYF